jgi:hypothetical protein
MRLQLPQWVEEIILLLSTRYHSSWMPQLISLKNIICLIRSRSCRINFIMRKKYRIRAYGFRDRRKSPRTKAKAKMFPNLKRKRRMSSNNSRLFMHKDLEPHPTFRIWRYRLALLPWPRFQ